jgi:choline dehydrogenase-like flavoprotein
MAFIANSQVNVDAWGKLGNPDWDWKTLEPYYKKTYTLTLPSEEQQKQLGLEYVDRQTSGFEGPLHASYPDAIKDPVANAWIESLRSLGFPMSSDPFSGNAVGGYINAATIEPVEKTRSYSQTAYYEPIKDRPNLRIITGALVEKILFRHTDPDEDFVATGCQYRNNGILHSVTARQTVIISAGVFNSPKILELSGIGSHAILEKHKIEVLIDNPNVGENLQDHVLAGLSFEVQDSINTKDDLMRRVPAALGAAMEEYKTNRFGPFTVGGNYSSALLPVPEFSNPATGNSELLQVLNMIPESSESSYSSDLISFVRSILCNPHEATGGYFTYPAQADFKGSGAGDEVLRIKFPENYITVAVSLLHPLSRGSSHITSSDVADSPVIDPRYLTHPLDVELLARHTRYIESIVASPPLASILKPGGKRSPGVPDDLRKAPLEEVKDYVKSAAKSSWHPTSTCSMMPREKGGVVDSRFRVWGTTNLRVVDASVIPIATRGNTQSSVYAIAERAVDLIKHDLVIT